MCPYGTFTATERLGDFADRHFLIISQDKRRPLVHADRFQSVSNTFLDMCTIQLPISPVFIRRRRGRMNPAAADIVPVPGQFAVVIYRRIGGDSIQPGGKRPVAAKPIELAEHFQPYFLDAILHLRMIQNDPITDAMNPIDMPVVQPGRGISVARLNCLNQSFIWHRILSIHHSHNTYESMNGNEYKELDLFFR
jgi:hypothetical protein